LVFALSFLIISYLQVLSSKLIKSNHCCFSIYSFHVFLCFHTPLVKRLYWQKSGFASDVLPEVHSPSAADSHTGVSTNYVPKVAPRWKVPCWFVLRVTYGRIDKAVEDFFAEYIDVATTIAAQSGGGGGGATSGWGRDKDEDELSWAHRCAMMANRLCRPRKKQGYGR